MQVRDLQDAVAVQPGGQVRERELDFLHGRHLRALVLAPCREDDGQRGQEEAAPAPRPPDEAQRDEDVKDGIDEVQAPDQEFRQFGREAVSAQRLEEDELRPAQQQEHRPEGLAAHAEARRQDEHQEAEDRAGQREGVDDKRRRDELHLR